MGIFTEKEYPVISSPLVEPLDGKVHIFNPAIAKNVNFSKALNCARHGRRIHRESWNIGVFVVVQKGYPNGIPSNAQTAKAWGINEGDTFKCNPYLQIRLANGSHSMWVPTNEDLFAEDWQIVEDWETIINN